MTEHLKNLVNSSREYRELLLKDDYRPLYHLTIPEGIGVPFDANAGIFHNGRHHMFYIFQDENGEHCFGHWVSLDLVHWTCLPAGPRPHETEGVVGMFSGNAFLDAENKVRIMYHNVSTGNSMLVAEDDDLTKWSPLTDKPMTNVSEDCDKFRSWDPCGWYEDGKYYAIYGWYQPALFSSDDGINFSYVGPFISTEEKTIEPYEDVSCPDFFKMNGKDVLMHISHARGWQYEIGTFDGKAFHPEHHGRMNNPGGQFFAGESYYDDKGRRILIAWVIDSLLTSSVKKLGWSGVMSLPRIVTMSEDQTELYSELPDELKSLRYNKRTLNNTTKAKKQSEVEIEANVSSNSKVGVKFIFSDTEYVDCFYDASNNNICIDISHSTNRDDVFYPVCPLDIVNATGAQNFIDHANNFKANGFNEGITEEMFKTGVANKAEAKLVINPNEKLHLNVFLDGSILELFANGRQAITVRIYPTKMDNCKAELINENSDIISSTLYDITPTNNY